MLFSITPQTQAASHTENLGLSQGMEFFAREGLIEEGLDSAPAGAPELGYVSLPPEVMARGREKLARVGK